MNLVQYQSHEVHPAPLGILANVVVTGDTNAVKRLYPFHELDGEVKLACFKTRSRCNL